MKRSLTTQRRAGALLAGVVFSVLAASHGLLAQSTGTDTADPTDKAIEAYHADANRTGYDPVNVALPLSTAWRVSGVAKKANPASLVAEDGTVYYGSGSNLVAVRLSDGQQKWSAAIPDDGLILSTPAIAGAYLYVGSTNGYFYKISRVDGSVAWSFKTGASIISSPVVAGNMVYFGSQDTNCYAVAADTGKVVWQFATNAPVNAPPSVGDGLAVFASSDYNVYSFSAVSGRAGWTATLPDDPSVGPAVISGSQVVMAAGQWVYGITAHTGSVRWKARFDGNVVSSPAVGPEEIFVATDDNNVYGLNNRGEIRWKQTVGAPPESGILVTQNAVIVGTKNGALYAFDPATGAIIWDYTLQPDATANATKVRIVGQPIYVNGTLLALSDDGALTAFRNDSPDAAPPKLSAQLPKAGDTVESKGLTFSANVIDYGSGVDPSSVKFTLDGTSLPGSEYDPDSNGVIADTVKSKGLELTNGSHIVKVTAKDWRGNSLSQSWAFIVDHTLNPAVTDDTTPPPADLTTVPSSATVTAPTAPGGFGGGGQAPQPAPSAPPPPPVF